MRFYIVGKKNYIGVKSLKVNGRLKYSYTMSMQTDLMQTKSTMADLN